MHYKKWGKMKNSLFKIGITLAVVFLLFNISFASGLDDDKEINNISKSNTTVHLGWAQATFYRISLNKYILFGRIEDSHSYGTILEFDTNLSEINIEVIIDYNAVMEYTYGPPIVLLTPFVAFGLKIENHTDYSWKYFKLKHENGLCEMKGNLSIDVTLDTSEAKKGDRIILYPKMNIITDPWLVSMVDCRYFPIKTSPLLRIAYLFPRLHDILLEPFIIPFYAKFNDYDCAWIVLDFV